MPTKDNKTCRKGHWIALAVWQGLTFALGNAR